MSFHLAECTRQGKLLIQSFRHIELLVFCHHNHLKPIVGLPVCFSAIQPFHKQSCRKRISHLSFLCNNCHRSQPIVHRISRLRIYDVAISGAVFCGKISFIIARGHYGTVRHFQKSDLPFSVGTTDGKPPVFSVRPGSASARPV